MIPCTDLTRKIIAVADTAYTASTDFTVAHGLAYAPKVYACLVRQVCVSVSTTDDTTMFVIVSTDATNVTIRPGRTKTCTIYLIIELDRDLGGRTPLV